MERSRDVQESLQADLSRIRAALRKLDLCESLERSAPHEARRLLSDAQRELHRLISSLSPAQPHAAGAAGGATHDDVQKQMTELLQQDPLLRAG